jgi:hypothetical protein
MTTVATWRCGCGTAVKVTGETDRTRPVSPQTAACPKCGLTQVVYVDVIISVAEDAQTATTSSKPKNS